MSLTSGKGPLSPTRAGWFSAPVPDGVVYVEPYRRRVRGVRDGTVVLDSERALSVHRPGRPPVWVFPEDEADGLPSEPAPEAPGYVQVPWGALDEWWEEGERVVDHPRNPYHRVDILRTDRRLRVEAAGAVLVDTTDTVALYETALDPKLYVAKAHVRTDLLTRSDTRTYCPYKGWASYWSANVAGAVVADVAWSYEDPLPESLPIAGLLSFDPARAQVLAALPPG